MKKININIFLMSVSFLFAAWAAQPAMARWQPETRTIPVNCSRGITLEQALGIPAKTLIIEIEGVCSGDVRIERDRVTLRGVTPDAALVGDAGNPGAVIEISGVSEINLVDLTIQGGESFGVGVRRNSEVSLERVRVVETPVIGLLLDRSSSALMIDSTIENHGLFGSALLGGSTLSVRGINEFSRNGQVGLLISDGSALATQGIGVVRADENGAVGVVLQVGSTGLFPSTEARRNGVAGLQVSFSSSFNSIGNNNDFSENLAFGALLTNSSQISAAGSFQSNGTAGIMAAAGSAVSVQTDVPTQILGSPVGVILEGAVGNFDTIEIDSMQLSFGAQVTFGPTVTLASLSCDETVLTRGSLSCPPSATASSGTVPARESALLSLEGLADSVRIFQLPDF